MFFGGGDMDDMMAQMMGQMGGMGGQQRRRKGRDVGLALPCTLEDLYTGRTVKLPRDKTILCPACQGRGTNKPSKAGTCTDCRGQGRRMVVRQMGPGMMQQMVVPCDKCGGQGSKIDPKDKCTTCDASKTKTVEAPLSVRVERGMEHQTQIPFRGEGDQSPDVETPGDIVIVIQQVKHDTFTREDSDLVIKKKITLAESLCGFQFTITHLDGRTLLVKSEPNKFVRPGEKKAILGEGMPIYSGPSAGASEPRFGDLIIEFQVTFPSDLEASQVDLLRKALPPPPTSDNTHLPSDAEHCYLTQQNLDELRKEMEKQVEDDDEDQQGGGGGQQVRCANQ